MPGDGVEGMTPAEIDDEVNRRIAVVEEILAGGNALLGKLESINIKTP